MVPEATWRAVGQGDMAALDAWLGSGGHVDFDRAATLLISEYRGGRLGQLTLETPAMAEQEHVKVAEIRRLKEEEKEAKKKARKAAYKAKGQK